MTGVAVEETSFETWDDCLSLSNGVVELVVTTGVGPRVLACRFEGGENLFHTDPDKEPHTGEFRIYGGHRFWHAPEDEERTYVPDNDPVEWDRTDRGVRLVQRTEEETGMQKTLSLTLAADDPVVEVTHELTNDGLWPVEAAPWGITLLRPDGTAVLPFSGGPDALLPDRSLTVWPYASLADDRLTVRDEAVLVDQDADPDGRLKIGASGADEWAAYVTDGVAFCKTFSYDDSATYPDRGSAVEVFTDESALELETLGPLETVDPGESAVHTETWQLVDGVNGAEDALERVPDLAP